MQDEIYCYSEELEQPVGVIDCNRDNLRIALREMRSILRAKREVRNYMPSAGVQKTEFIYPSYDGAKIKCYLLQSCEVSDEKRPCIIYYHGGGFMMPLQKMMLCNADYYAQQTGAAVFLPEYRYAPKVKCKTTIEDCFCTVEYVRAHADELKIDKEKMIIYGDSAGGALAAGVTHLMKQRKLPKAAGQMLIYPVTDYHSENDKSMEMYKDAVWPKKSNDYMWKLYLKGADEKTKELAAPLNLQDFSKLPPAYVEPQEIDILRDQGIAYAEKLKQEGCLLELNVIGGSYHGFDFDHNSPLVQRVLKHRCEIMKRMLTEEGDRKSEKV